MLTSVGLALVQVVGLLACLVLGLYTMVKLEEGLADQLPARVLLVRMGLLLTWVALGLLLWRRMGF